MATQKTKIAPASVDDFLNTITDEQKRKDCEAIIKMMKKISGHDPKLVMGGSIIGFGKYHYKYASGHEGDSVLLGLSPRKANISLYLMGMYLPSGKAETTALLKKLGKHKAGKGCLYINRLQDVDEKVLKEIIEVSLKALLAWVEEMKKGM